MKIRAIALAVTGTLAACEKLPTRPAFDGHPPILSATVVPSGSSLRLTAQANAVSNSTADGATVTNTDSDVQAGTTDPLSVSVSAVSNNGAGTLEASGGIAATWVDTDAGQVVWNVAWQVGNLPASPGSFVAVPAIAAGDGWIYTFIAEVDGHFTLDFNIITGGSNTFGLSPFNFLWLPAGAPLPEHVPMAQGTSGSVEKTVSAGLQYMVSITNNSGLTTTGSSMSNRTAHMTATFDWQIVPHFLLVDIDIKPGSYPNCFDNDGHGVIPVAILGSAGFDVTMIDPSTVMLESLAVRAVGRNGNLQAHTEDVNADGSIDLVVQIEDADGAFTSGAGTATLTGELLDGTPIRGTDEICVVPSD